MKRGTSNKRLLSRITKDEDSSIDPSFLYETYKLESLEIGEASILERRQFSETVTCLFNVKIISKRIKGGIIKKLFKGIKLNPLEDIPKASTGTYNVQDIAQYVPTSYIIKSQDSHKLTVSKPTQCLSNGHIIEKVVTFFDNGQWKLVVAGEAVNLDNYGIDSHYIIDKLNIVFSCTESLKLCCGMNINNSIISTRLHTIEQYEDKQQKITRRCLRSRLCLKVLKITSRSMVCNICQKMTISKSPNSSSTKENASRTIDKSTLKRMIPAASENMIELLMSQIDNAAKPAKGRRWSRTIVNVCLQVFSRSPVGYRTLQSSGLLVLPSPRLLVLYKGRVQHRPGFHSEIFSWMHAEAKRLEVPPFGLRGGIVLDEMSIQQDLQILKNGDVVELRGLSDVGEEGNTCTTLRNGKKEQVIGTHILQFIFLGLTGFRFPFGFFVTTNVAAYTIHTLFWEAVSALSLYGFEVLYVSMDGAQSNRTFKNLNLGKNSNSMVARSPETPNKAVVFMMDISHVIKKIRNNLLKSGEAQGCTRNLTLTDGKVIQWQMWKDAFHWDQKNALKLHRKLSTDHIYLTSQSKMRNHLAEEVLSGDMLHLITIYKKSLKHGDVLDGAIHFLEATSRLVEIFHDDRPIHSLDDPRLTAITSVKDWFLNWETGIHNLTVPTKEKSKKLMSAQCHEDIQSSLIGFCELCDSVLSSYPQAFVTPALINSDIVENHFCQQRATYNGANSNPTVLQYAQNQNAIILGQNIVSNKSNAGKPVLNRVAQSYKFHDNLNQIKRKRVTDSCSAFKNIKVLRL